VKKTRGPSVKLDYSTSTRLTSGLTVVEDSRDEASTALYEMGRLVLLLTNALSPQHALPFVVNAASYGAR
jgi:hypothetical protein